MEKQEGRKSVYINVSVSPILKEELEELVKAGYFSNLSDAVRYAIHQMLAEFRAKGKLKPKREGDIEKRSEARIVSEEEREVD